MVFPWFDSWEGANQNCKHEKATSVYEAAGKGHAVTKPE